MGKATGFLEYERQEGAQEKPELRVRHFEDYHKLLTPAQQSCQGARCMSCGVPFCQAGVELAGATTGCPLHNMIPETNDLVYRGNWAQAYHRLSSTHGLPEFTSRVCPALCEQACAVGFHSTPVTNRENEKAIIEYAFAHGLVEEKAPEVRTGKTVAIVGSGPAGLAAAQLLNRRGHKVTVFEKSERIGGLLRYGIPNMKLDKRIIDRRVRMMEEAGIEFVCGVDVGTDITGEEMLARYDRVVLCCGAARPRDLTAPGRDTTKGIYLAIDFLTEVNRKLMDLNYDSQALIDCRKFSFRSVKGKHVIIVGGGDTATDCVATCLRLGAASVKQMIRRPRPAAVRGADNPWPEQPKVFRTDYGQEEAACLQGEDPRMYQTMITEFLPDQRGWLKAVVAADTKPETDAQGRTVMVPVEGSERKVKADIVLIAAGFAGAESYVMDAFGVEADRRTNVKTASGSYQTTTDRVFTAGDMHRGQSLVVWAIAEGRQAAKAVDESLMGYSNL